MKDQKTWFITGASRGLGLEITKAVLASGDKVVAGARNRAPELEELKHENLFIVSLDVTQEEQVIEAIGQAISKFGKFDVLLNNAGFGLLSAVEEASDKEIRHMYDTNVFGTLNVIRHTLPHLRNQRSGHIINISSVGGLSGSAGWGLYNSTKFAVEGFSEALSKELTPLNIHVTAVEPGYFRTNFLDESSLNTISNIIDDYEDTVGKMRSRAVMVNKMQPGDPKKLADALIQIVYSQKPPLHLPLGKDALESYQIKTANFANDIEAWKNVITGTDHSS
ncbi:SDR family NAD(P)-dependent oxidoreductase [Pedobacter hiemivivus]|uniref:SDR family NAD(P)-dependent oxidoreductase n=1 Tax=Pedobacter hiemivivus TaxID=2530454 RepID=A0A4V5PEN8_9SPHI|nr:oxidoreductase [Pedobacter hiemivivus]TKC65666.1 SDR family NAD(P)-dependent oxidoreductase [Pedobacter hiemivivus]